MSTSWLIKKNADAPVLLSASGVTSCVLSLRANGVDSMTFTQSDDWLASPAWPFATRVCLIRRETAGEDVTDVCLFVGTVESIPRQAAGAGPQSIVYTALGPAYALQLCDYSQEWHYTNASTGADTTIYEPTVVLGEDNNGTRLSSGQVISHAAAYAVSRGVSIDLGTVAAGVTVPLDERDNIKCWDAVVVMLRYTPDYVLWFDYDHQVDGDYVPALNVTAPASMDTLTRAVSVPEEAAFTPRLDIRVPGILITYRWTGTYAGKTVKSRSTDSAGTVSDPRRVSLVYDLEGATANFVEQEVEVEDYPADWTGSAGKAFIAARIPWLAQLDSADWSVVSCNGDGAEAYPSQLLNGAVPDWTGKETESETFTVEVEYVQRSTDTDTILESGTRKLTFSAVSTNADTQTYRKLTEWIEAEPIVSGLAAALYASWNRLHYDGQATFHAQECDTLLTVGKLLSCTGGLAEWETMAAVIQQVDHDIGAGKTTVRTGTCARLEADNLMAVYRAARGRRFSVRRLGRTDPDASDGGQIGGSFNAANDSVADGVPPCLRTRFAVEATNAEAATHLVDVDPASLSPDGGALETAPQTVKLRQIEILVNDGPDENGDARVAIYKAYALVSEPAFARYEVMSAIPVGGGGEVTPETLTVQHPLSWDSVDPNMLIIKFATNSGLATLYTGETLVGLAVDVRAHSGLKIDTSSPSKGLQLEGLTPDTAPSAAFVWGWNGTAYGKYLLTTVSLT